MVHILDSTAHLNANGPDDFLVVTLKTGNIRPIDAVRIFFLLTNFSVGLRIFLTELHKKNL